MSISEAFSTWAATNEHGPHFVLIECDEESGKLVLTMQGLLVTVFCPKSADGIFMVDTDEGSLLGWSGQLSSFALENPGCDLGAFLDKAVALRFKKAAPVAEVDEDGDDDMFDVDGWDDDDDVDEDEEWGDVQEADVAGMQKDDAEFNKWFQLKKRWKKREAELRQTAAEVDAQRAEQQIFSSEAASKILTNTLIELMKEGEETGVLVEPVDDNIFHWAVKIQDFPSDCELYRDLKQLKSRYGYESVELEFKFLMDLFPFYPPSVRLVRPRLKNFLMGRIVCMEELQLSKWNPVRKIGEIMQSVKRLLSSYGAVDNGSGNVNDPSRPDPPYTALEFQLLRLSMLTEIAPRVIQTLQDSEQRDLPKFGVHTVVKKRKTEFTTKRADEPTYNQYDSSGYDNNTPWAKGTGYGHSGQEDWDVEAYLAAQRKRDAEIREILDEMLAELRKDSIPQSLPEVMQQSCLIPFLEQYLSNDSITDIEQHFRSIYKTVFEIVVAMANHAELAPLFTPLPYQKKSLFEHICTLRDAAKFVRKMETAANSGSSSSAAAAAAAAASSSSSASSAGRRRNRDEDSVSLVILNMASCVESVMSGLDTDVTMAPADSEAAPASTTAATIEHYEAVMEPLKFDEVGAFRHHHYTGQPRPTLTRLYVKRLASEYSDLSKSLPVFRDSSCFMRVHEETMSLCQLMIAAPDGTPYERGLFLFDVYFPTEYPNGPPKVNLQTTGGGSVRFNPNLYNCGKVCLSLLGTWQGQQGESWNAATSTFLQVVISIQSLIFVPMPFFNEPGYERELGTPQGTRSNNEYNSSRRVATVRWAMLEQLKSPPPGFEDIVRNHFYLQQDIIYKQLEGWASDGTMGSGDASKLRKLIGQLKTEIDKIKAPMVPA